MADPIQTLAKAQRLAEALRANLKRRKEQTRERTSNEGDVEPSEASVTADGAGQAAPRKPQR